MSEIPADFYANNICTDVLGVVNLAVAIFILGSLHSFSTVLQLCTWHNLIFQPSFLCIELATVHYMRCIILAVAKSNHFNQLLCSKIHQSKMCICWPAWAVLEGNDLANNCWPCYLDNSRWYKILLWKKFIFDVI